MQIKIAVRDVSVEYEGDEEFFKSSLPDILKKMAEISSPAGAPVKSGVGQAEEEPKAANGQIPSHSTNTIAKLTNATTGPDLIMAAVAKIIIVDGKDVARRNEITKEMRAATSYYKKTYSNNLSKYLDTLTKADSLRLAAEDTYGLPAKPRESIEAKLRE